MSESGTSIPFFHRRALSLDRRNRRYATAALRYSLRRELSSRLPLICEDEPSDTPSNMADKTPQSPSSSVASPTVRTPAQPFPPSTLAALAADRSSRRLRRRELSQLMHEHLMHERTPRGSFLSTASIALGMGPRGSKSSSISEKDTNLAMPIKKAGQKDEKISIWRRIKQWAQYLYEISRLKYILPLLILVGYSFLGGAVIYWIEAPIERWQIEGKQKFLDEQKFLLSRTLWEVKESKSEKGKAMMILRESVYWYTIATLYMEGNFTRLPPPTSDVEAKVETLKTYTEQMAQRCWEIKLEMHNQSDAHRKIHNSLQLFEDFTGVSTEVKPIWTFSNALFLAITIYTTIGYGSVAPHTVAGRVATIIYAIIGIPIYVMIIHKLGRLCLKLLHKFWKVALRFMRYWRCARRSRKKRQAATSEDDEESVNNIPVSLAVGVTFAWMLTCAGVCCLFIETSWDYFTSFYFFFISLTTIGLGDVTPTHPDYMFTMFGLIIVGLSLVSMCINVVQLKLELLFEEMMLALMEEYEKTGKLIDGEIVVEPADFQRGLGFSQMFKLWKKKRAAKKNTGAYDGDVPAASASGLLLPLMARQRHRTVFKEWQRRIEEKTIGTQTEKWQVDHWRGWLEREQGTQTDWATRKSESSLVTCTSGDEEEKFFSNLSLYSHQDCFHRHALTNPEGGSGPGPCHHQCHTPAAELPRPWSSMDTRTPVAQTGPLLFRSPSNVTPTDNRPQLPVHGRYSLQNPGVLPNRRLYDHQFPLYHSGASHSVPYYYRTSASAFAQHPQIDHGRYWLAHFTPGAPPGGGVPAMAIKRQSKEQSCDDFKTLIREIGCRLDECRHIVTQKEPESEGGRHH